MDKVCQKCGVTSQHEVINEYTGCPACGVIYAKYDAAVRRIEENNARNITKDAVRKEKKSRLGIGRMIISVHKKALELFQFLSSPKEMKNNSYMKRGAIIFLLSIFILGLFLPKNKVSSLSVHGSRESEILKDIENLKNNTELKPVVLSEQQKYAESALEALYCVEKEIECTPSFIESSLKGLPIGWVEKALGPPYRIQRLDEIGELHYWKLDINEDGRSRSYTLQLQYSSSCSTSVNGGQGACKFNFL